MNSIELKPVTSSKIAAIGHDPDTNTLAIKFPDRPGGIPGPVYHYANFTRDDYVRFASAASLGSHFIRFIKPATDKHPYTKVS